MKKRKRSADRAGEEAMRTNDHRRAHGLPAHNVPELIAALERAGRELEDDEQSSLARDADFYARELRIWYCTARLRWPVSVTLALFSRIAVTFRESEKVVCVDDLASAEVLPGTSALQAGRTYVVRAVQEGESGDFGVLLVGISAGRFEDGTERAWNVGRFRTLAEVKEAFARAKRRPEDRDDLG